MPDDQVSVGEMLILREEFWQTQRKEQLTAGVRKRAAVMVRLLDELIDRRRKEAALQ